MISCLHSLHDRPPIVPESGEVLWRNSFYTDYVYSGSAGSVVPRSNILQADARRSICAEVMGDNLGELRLTGGDPKLSLD